MMDKTTAELFEKAPAARAVLKHTVPAMAAMLMVLVYNLADTFFIGQTHNAILVAAVSLATPVFLIFMAVGTVFGAGGASVISRAFGQGVQPLLGYCVGAKLWTRFKEIMRVSLCFALGLYLWTVRNLMQPEEKPEQKISRSFLSCF